MRIWLVLFILNVLFACGGEKTQHPEIERPVVKPPPICQVFTDALTGHTHQVMGGVNLILTQTGFTVEGNPFFMFSVAAHNGPGCQPVELKSLPFQIAGSNPPTFSSWMLINDTYQEEGVIAEGLIDGANIEVDLSNLSIHPNNEKKLFMVIRIDQASAGQAFVLEISGPVVWSVWQKSGDYYTMLPALLSAMFTF